MEKLFNVSVKSLSLLVVYCVAMGYGANIGYYAGYFSAFEIDIQMIPFWPSLFDFMTRGIATAISIVVSLVIYVVLMVCGNLVVRLGKKLAAMYRLEWLEWFVSGLYMSKRSMLAGLMGCFVIISLASVLYVSYGSGVRDAHEENDFTVVVSPSADAAIEVVLYQNDGLIVTKAYDPQKKDFLNGYSIVEAKDKTYDKVTLER